MDTRQAIEGSYLAKGVSGECIDAMVALASTAVYGPGETIIALNEPGDDLMILVLGLAETCAITGETLHMIHPGTPFGEVAFLDGKARSATILAKEPCVVVKLPREPLLELWEKAPECGYKAMANLALLMCARVRSANAHLSVLLTLEETSLK